MSDKTAEARSPLVTLTSAWGNTGSVSGRPSGDPHPEPWASSGKWPDLRAPRSRGARARLLSLYPTTRKAPALAPFRRSPSGPELAT